MVEQNTPPKCCTPKQQALPKRTAVGIILHVERISSPTKGKPERSDKQMNWEGKRREAGCILGNIGLLPLHSFSYRFA
jgi:hypothetical protein